MIFILFFFYFISLLPFNAYLSIRVFLHRIVCVDKLCVCVAHTALKSIHFYVSKCLILGGFFFACLVACCWLPPRDKRETYFQINGRNAHLQKNRQLGTVSASISLLFIHFLHFSVKISQSASPSPLSPSLLRALSLWCIK